MGADTVLLGDLGGTNARFAVLSQGEPRGKIGHAAKLSVADHASAAEAMAAYSAWLAKEVGIAMAVGSVPYAIGFAWLGHRLALDYLRRREARRRDRRAGTGGVPAERATTGPPA